MPVEDNKILWSICILSIPERLSNLDKIYKKLSKDDRVEIITLLDNKSISIAEKRNKLLSISRGKFVSFLDDDDDVDENFVNEILKVIEETQQKSPNDLVDVIVFDQKCIIDGKTLMVNFNVGNPHEPAILNEKGEFNPIKRPPYHMHIWKKEIACSERFRSVYFNGQSSEDIDWLLRLYPKIRTFAKINKVLHYYIYNSKTTASRNDKND